MTQFWLVLFVFSFLPYPLFHALAENIALYHDQKQLIGAFQTEAQLNWKEFNITIYSAPDEDSKILFQDTLTGYGYLKSQKEQFTIPVKMFEIGYETTGFSVFNRKGDWFQVSLSVPSAALGWIKISKGDQYTPLLKLFENALTYATPEWDQKLYASPAAKTLIKVADQLEKHQSFKLLETKTIDGQIWFKIQLISGVCELETKLLQSGWIPLLSQSGKFNAWYHSRGC